MSPMANTCSKHNIFMSQNTLKLGRTFREGWASFRRNGWLSVATVTVFTLSLLLVGLTSVFGFATGLLLQNLEDKINISVAFNVDTEESRILEMRQALLTYQEIASVDYISRDAALDQFIKTSGDDPNIAKALDEIGGNPLPASLTIRAKRPDQYDAIATAVANSVWKDDIARINYEKNKKIIETVATSSQSAKQTGLILAAIFILVSIIVAFNTIRINMHSRKQEYEIMRLVGASNTYMRLPSVFEGLLYGTSAAVVAAILLVPAIGLIGSSLVFFLPAGFLLSYYASHWFLFFIALVLLGATLGTLSGYLALNKYLKV